MLNNNTIIPHVSTLQEAAKLSCQLDKPIMLDYYTSSIQRNCRLVKTQDKHTILFKDNEAYTSPLNKILQIEGSRTEAGSDIICITENSIYIIYSNVLPTKS
jgi:hypothetical protein